MRPVLGLCLYYRMREGSGSEVCEAANVSGELERNALRRTMGSLGNRTSTRAAKLSANRI